MEGRQNPSCAGRWEASGAVCTLTVAPRTVVASGSSFGGVDLFGFFFFLRSAGKLYGNRCPERGARSAPKHPPPGQNCGSPLV